MRDTHRQAAIVARVARALDKDRPEWADMIDKDTLFRSYADPTRNSLDGCIMVQVYGEYDIHKADELVGSVHGEDLPLSESPFWTEFTDGDYDALRALWAVEIDTRTTAQETGE